MELLYRDEFGVHDRQGEPAPALWRRVAASVATQLFRPRRFSPEYAFWTVIVVLLVLFVVVLVTGSTGVARGGR